MPLTLGEGFCNLAGTNLWPDITHSDAFRQNFDSQILDAVLLWTF